MELLFFGFEFFRAQICRHTDTTVFNEHTSLKTTLLLTMPACPEDLVVAIVVDLRETFAFSTFLCFFP